LADLSQQSAHTRPRSRVIVSLRPRLITDILAARRKQGVTDLAILTFFFWFREVSRGIAGSESRRLL